MSGTGCVYLVGAGPGDPGLLTLKGLKCLQRADVVLYDRLVNRLLLRHISPGAQRTSRVSMASGRRLNQEQVNRQLIEAAREGKTVVRLKGGDPFIFGRGSEEAVALREAGIPFEVVPGITAATAASEYAGFSLTHREHASAVAFVTGHEDPTKEGSLLDYKVLAAFPGTLVFYMGLHRLEEIAAALIEAGKDPGTPAAMVNRATTPNQRTVTARLEDLPGEVRRAGLRAPSLILVGECVSQRETVAWFEEKPLFGKRIGITRPGVQADSAIERALELGAQPVLLPTIAIQPPEDWSRVDAVLDRLEEFDWLIFTSANGVIHFLERLWERGGDWRRLSSLKLATIGPATAEKLAEYHLKADLVPETYRAEALAEALKPKVKGKRVLWARANRGRDVLPEELKQAGAEVEMVTVYRNDDVQELPAQELEMLERGEVDWVGLSSPSIARGFKKLLTPEALSQVGEKVRLVTISPVTTQAAEEAGLPVNAEATSYTWEGIFEAIRAAEGEEK